MPRKKKPGIITTLVKEAQIHGINKLADENFKFYWAIALLLVMATAVSVLMLQIMRFLSNPTYIARKEMYRTNMTFPTVILCPELNYQDHKIEAFLNRVNYPNNINRTYVRSVIKQLITFYNTDVKFNLEDLENLERLLDYNDISLREVTESLTTSCEEAILRDLENGANMISKPVYNLSTVDVGYKSGLVFVVNQSSKVSNMDLTYKWVSVTNPQRYVDSTTNGTPLSPGKEVWLGYDSISFHVSENARELNPGLRHCVMSTTALEYFPVYHKEAMWHCNCILFTHPSRRNVPFCKAKNMECARIIAGSVNAGKCGCPATCDVDTAEISIVDFMMSPELKPIDSF
ncbi:sodium channel protein Nach-like [Ostrinia furnacalis]|uniref:sodium channel protein Nach-like n=1 Tax=Ostrinia furnacalis TaxID=93504 RepID=UPI001038E518|nr:sodium channel protein Nach-like [Ostrinia furnacalis]